MSSISREPRHRASGQNQDGRRRQQHAGVKTSVQKKHTSKRDRIRLLEHLLKKEDLPENARQKAQHELDQLHAAQQETKRIEKEKKLATKYHKIKFFERVKIERAIAKLQRQQAAGLSTEQQQELQQLQQDLLYVRHFPPGEKYVSLLKKAESPEVQEKLDAERQRLRALVQKRLQAAAQAAADKAALTEADEGKQKAIGQLGKIGISTAVSKNNNGVATLAPPHADVEDAGNDDDFFMSEEEDSEELHDHSQMLRGKHTEAKPPVVARAWPKPAQAGDESSSDDDVSDDQDEEVDTTQHTAGLKRNADKADTQSSVDAKRPKQLHNNGYDQRQNRPHDHEQQQQKQQQQQPDSSKKQRRRRRKSTGSKI